MARSRRPTDETPPDDWVPTQAVDNPILNSPYEEPREHWTYQGGTPQKIPSRRPASYWFRTSKVGEAQQGLFAEEERDDLPLVNRLREDVRRWREANYRGASPVTKDLFRYWFSPERSRRLFFCQREAVETIVYMLELALPGRLATTGFKKFEIDSDVIARLLKGEKPGFVAESTEHWPRLIDPPSERQLLPLRRLGCKMATGSGKTVVMAMVIAWAFANRGRNPASTHYPNGVLICAPNLTIKKRLQVLRPDAPDGTQSYYDAFDLVPSQYRELVAAGKVLVTNWHGFQLKNEHREGDASYAVVQKGVESPEAFTRDRLGQDFVDRLPILVLNDEGHHCWRPQGDAKAVADLSAEERKALEEEKEEARIWLMGLDRINNCGIKGKEQPGILATVDLSATPFYLAASGYPEGSPFPWLVSDFGLVDAIESGIVKIPRLPVLDDTRKKDEAGRPDPKYFRLWRHVVDNLKAKDRIGKRPKPEAVYREAEGALITLAGQWQQRFKQIQRDAGDAAVPPVMIVVCDNTEVSEVVFQALSGERKIQVEDDDGKLVERTTYDQSKVFPEFQNEDGIKRTIRIDSKLLSKIETEEGETKDVAAKALRDLIDSVGKPGKPGEQVRCVVSVSMLTEGWDANNVTHVLGLRAFGSQLLCEQVVGRGLRRMSYDVNTNTGLLEPEYVDVYGIPFSLIPFKGRPKDAETNDRPLNRVFADPEKTQFRMSMPVVESYHYDVRTSGIRCEVSSLEALIVNDEPTAVYLQAPRGYEDEGSPLATSEFVKQTREAFYENTRPQQVLFRLSQMIMEDLIRGGTGIKSDELKRNLYARHLLFPEILRIVKEYVARKVTFAAGVDARELALEKYANLLRERVLANILPAAASAESPLLPIVNSFSSVVSTDGVEDHTVLPIYRLRKSHLNAAPIHSMGDLAGGIGERAAIDVIESLEFVEAFTPNHRKIGFQIPYDYQGDVKHYEPDFIVRVVGGTQILLEIKGGKGEVHGEDLVNAKNAGARKWVAAVNNAGRWGKWAFEICRELPSLTSQLQRHVLEGTASAAG